MRESVNLREAEAGALADRLGGEERIEYLAENVGRDADPGILDADGDMVSTGQLFGPRTGYAR